MSLSGGSRAVGAWSSVPLMRMATVAVSAWLLVTAAWTFACVESFSPARLAAGHGLELEPSRLLNSNNVGHSLPLVGHHFHAVEDGAFTLYSSSPSSSAVEVKQQQEQQQEQQQQEQQEQSEETKEELLRRDRYVATNRFAVRKGAEAKFEKRWATRKSRLASLEGFKYFHLMRRVTLNNEDTAITYNGGAASDSSDMGNYVSFTVWDQKKHFTAWRTGEAFKEAHGGTSIGAFVSAMISSALVLRGPPRPAFYDGLLVQSTKPQSIPQTIDGWRSVQADGKNVLPAECFVACNQFFVPRENAAQFERRWADRESTLKDCDGFVAFSMLRRDISPSATKGHGMSPVSSDEPTYISTTIWRDRKAFDQWRNGSAFKKAHGASAANNSKNDNENSSTSSPPPKPLWTKPPIPVFYEGTLVVTTEDGA